MGAEQKRGDDRHSEGGLEKQAAVRGWCPEPPEPQPRDTFALARRLCWMADLRGQGEEGVASIPGGAAASAAKEFNSPPCRLHTPSSCSVVILGPGHQGTLGTMTAELPLRPQQQAGKVQGLCPDASAGHRALCIVPRRCGQPRLLGPAVPWPWASGACCLCVCLCWWPGTGESHLGVWHPSH